MRPTLGRDPQLEQRFSQSVMWQKNNPATVRVRGKPTGWWTRAMLRVFDPENSCPRIRAEWLIKRFLATVFLYGIDLAKTRGLEFVIAGIESGKLFDVFLSSGGGIEMGFLFECDL